MNRKELQELLFAEIPISKSMGLTVSSVDPLSVQIGFRLEENRNHKKTAFGGSQYTACTLACYGLFLSAIREQGFMTNDIVIAEGRIKYSLPVKHDFCASAQWDQATKAEFFNKLKKKSKARVTLRATLEANGSPCAEFEGLFVASLPPAVHL